MTQLRPIVELNQLDVGAFAEALRPLFEAPGPLARALHAERPYAAYSELIDRAESIVRRLSLAEQIEVMSAHPRIGESAAEVKHTSALSYREQGYEREASLPAEVVRRTYDELAGLNRAYEDHFGFRFVVFVNGRPKQDIVDVLRERLRNSRDAELRAGLGAMMSIARDRLRMLSE